MPIFLLRVKNCTETIVNCPLINYENYIKAEKKIVLLFAKCKKFFGEYRQYYLMKAHYKPHTRSRGFMWVIIGTHDKNFERPRVHGIRCQLVFVRISSNDASAITLLDIDTLAKLKCCKFAIVLLPSHHWKEACDGTMFVACLRCYMSPL